MVGAINGKTRPFQWSTVLSWVWLSALFKANHHKYSCNIFRVTFGKKCSVHWFSATQFIESPQIELNFVCEVQNAKKLLKSWSRKKVGSSTYFFNNFNSCVFSVVPFSAQ